MIKILFVTKHYSFQLIL